MPAPARQDEPATAASGATAPADRLGSRRVPAEGLDVPAAPAGDAVPLLV
jgi:hypothetical protein